MLHICNHMMSKAKSDYDFFSHEHILKIFVNCGNPSILCFIGTNPKYCLIPPHWIYYVMFSKYFTDKTAHIRLRFVIKNVDCHVAEQSCFGNTLQCFTPTTISEVL